MVKRIDVDLAEQIIATAGNSRVPIPAVLEASSPLNVAMDNFEAPWQEQGLLMILYLFSSKMFERIWRNHQQRVNFLQDPLPR